MATYRVPVKIVAEVEYTVEVEADSIWSAESKAVSMWRDNTPSDFQVDKGYISSYEADAEQITWECEECGKSISESESTENVDRCNSCAREEAA